MARGRYSRRRLAKAGIASEKAKTGNAEITAWAGPAIDWTGRAATWRRTSAVALTAVATTALLSVVGTCAPRAPAVPLNADNKADKSRIRFKRALLHRL